MATEREYELESKLYDVMVAAQDYIIAIHEGRTAHNTFYENKLKKLVNEYRENTESYLQHPKWDEVDIKPPSPSAHP